MKTKQEIVSEAYLKELEWADMTDSNLHTEVRYQIAKHFGYEDKAAYFSNLLSKDYLRICEVQEREEQTKLLLLSISLDYSHNVAVFINGLL